MKQLSPFLASLLLVLLLTACGVAQSAALSTPSPAAVIPDSAPTTASPAQPAPTADAPASPLDPEEVSTGLPTATPTGPPTSPPTDSPAISDPQAWKNLPVIPEVSPRVAEIYRRGQELGNNPHAFSNVGDCGSTPAWFLGDFDLGPKYYRLGPYADLSAVIQHFSGSFERASLASKAGFNASSVLTPLWADRSQCEAGESPLACEYRLHRPVMALITLGTNDISHPDRFEPQMRRVIEFSLEQGVIPILSTKADNLEGDDSLNVIIARLAVEYEIPLWNYWLAVQPLPNGGLQKDGAHLTWAPNRFDDPKAMTRAWPVRNLTALQTLDAVWSEITENSDPQP